MESFFLPAGKSARIFFCYVVICFGGSHGQIWQQKKRAMGNSPEQKTHFKTINHTLFIPLPTAIIHTTAAPPTNCLFPPLSVCRRPPPSAAVRRRPLPSTAVPRHLFPRTPPSATRLAAIHPQRICPHLLPLVPPRSPPPCKVSLWPPKTASFFNFIAAQRQQ